MLFKNPALAAAQADTKWEREKVAGKKRKILEEFSSEDERGKLSLMPDDETLVIVEGWDISDKAILYEYLHDIEFDLISEILG